MENMKSKSKNISDKLRRKIELKYSNDNAYLFNKHQKMEDHRKKNKHKKEQLKQVKVILTKYPVYMIDEELDEILT